jgi:hypothetical protein
MQQMGPPLAFQTATAAKVGDLSGALALAASQGAYSVELPVSYVKEPPQALAAANASFGADGG